MKIGIDASMLVYRGSGVANYTHNLILTLLAYDQSNEYKIFYSSLRRPKKFNCLKQYLSLGAKIYNYPIPPKILKLAWNKYHVFPVEYLIGKVDYFFSSDFLRPPLLKGTKGITTIHDLTWKIYPQYHTKDIVQAHTNKLKKTLKYKDIIIVDSENTKKDLFNNYPEAKNNKVYVIYPGVDKKFRPIKDKKLVKQVFKKYKLLYPANYLLYVGAIEPRKNLGQAIKVFAQLLKDKQYETYKFLIIGRAGWKNKDIFKQIKTSSLDKKVVFVGYVADDDLPYFYNGAKTLIYLSLYEGFGLPPLEAAKCNIPTLLYQNSSLQELFADGYPYTKNGHELNDLKNILQKKSKITHFTKNFSWKKFYNKFATIIS